MVYEVQRQPSVQLNEGSMHVSPGKRLDGRRKSRGAPSMLYTFYNPPAEGEYE